MTTITLRFLAEPSTVNFGGKVHGGTVEVRSGDIKTRQMHRTTECLIVFVAVFLDAQNRVLEVEELFRGTLTQTSVFPREIVKRALHFNAAAVIFAHNHPSGGLEPSPSDIEITAQLKAAGDIVGIELLDHIIFNRTGYFSFLEEGKL